MRTVRGEFIEIITQDHYQLVTTPPSIFGLIDGEAYMGAASIYRSAIESLVRLTRVDDAKKYKSGSSKTAVEYPGVSGIRPDCVWYFSIKWQKLDKISKMKSILHFGMIYVRA